VGIRDITGLSMTSWGYPQSSSMFWVGKSPDPTCSRCSFAGQIVQFVKPCIQPSLQRPEKPMASHCGWGKILHQLIEESLIVDRVSTIQGGAGFVEHPQYVNSEYILCNFEDGN